MINYRDYAESDDSFPIEYSLVSEYMSELVSEKPKRHILSSLIHMLLRYYLLYILNACLLK